MEFVLDYILENEKVRLEPLSEKHLEGLMPFALNEPEIWTYSLQTCFGEANLKSYVLNATLGREKEIFYPFVVIDKKTGLIAGTTRFYDINLVHKFLTIGYTWYGKDFQGTGLNKACKYLLLEFAFERAGVERVEFRVDANNTRSLAAVKSIGAFQEGILRSNGIAANGKRRDSAVFSILKNEWLEKVKSELYTKF